MRYRLWLLNVVAASLAYLLGPAQCLGISYVFTTIDVPGAANTHVNGINNHGDVVGTYVQDGTGFGFLFDGQTFTTLTYPGAQTTMATGINDTGEIVGSYGSLPFLLGNHGFLFDHGEYTTLDVPGGTIMEAEDINNQGQITGIVADSEGVHGFLLDGEDYFRLTVPGANRTEGLGLNDAGVVAGRAYEGEPIYGNWTGFTHDASGFDLIHPCGTASASLADINNSGQLVGWCEPDPRIGGYVYGFFLDGADYTRIQFPGATTTMATGLNDEGQIVGYYSAPEYGTHGFIATPVPEPSTWILLLSGVTCVVCLVLWRRRGNTNSVDQVSLNSVSRVLLKELSQIPSRGAFVLRNSCLPFP